MSQWESAPVQQDSVGNLKRLRGRLSCLSWFQSKSWTDQSELGFKWAGQNKSPLTSGIVQVLTLWCQMQTKRGRERAVCVAFGALGILQWWDLLLLCCCCLCQFAFLHYFEPQCVSLQFLWVFLLSQLFILDGPDSDSETHQTPMTAVLSFPPFRHCYSQCYAAGPNTFSC